MDAVSAQCSMCSLVYNTATYSGRADMGLDGGGVGVRVVGVVSTVDVDVLDLSVEWGLTTIARMPFEVVIIKQNGVFGARHAP